MQLRSLVLPFGWYCIGKVESLDGVGEVTHEVGTTEFTAREQLETNLLLALENAKDVAIFDCPQLSEGTMQSTGTERFGGAEKAPDMVGAIEMRHVHFLSKLIERIR